jgi:hypothetical protein
MGLSWKPIRRGQVYCSPACGRGCTRLAFEKATACAKTLARLLPGFEPRVWENLGWHWEVCCGSLTVGPRVGRGYSATYDSIIWVDGRTPKAALQRLAAAWTKHSCSVDFDARTVRGIVATATKHSARREASHAE